MTVKQVRFDGFDGDATCTLTQAPVGGGRGRGGGAAPPAPAPPVVTSLQKGSGRALRADADGSR